jgi:phosphoglycerate kinase
MRNSLKLTPMQDLEFENKRVLLRLDINSPIDSKTKKIVNDNRIQKSIPTLNYLIDQNSKIAIIAHQGDTLDYHNLIPLKEHAEKLTKLLNRNVKYIDDVCGPGARDAIKNLKNGELIILGNVRYLCEEISTFEDTVKLTPKEMLNTYIVRNLAPLFDVYVNDAFAAAHRNAPSIVAFQELLPAAAGDLLFKEMETLTKIKNKPAKPSVFVLGGAKISDAFSMMKQVLENGSADKILTSGITGEIFLLAKGISIGEKKMKFIKDRSLDLFIEPAKEYLNDYSDKIEIPVDLAFEKDGKREEIEINTLPVNEMFMDIGNNTIDNYRKIINGAKTIFVNGPAGVYENKIFENGTKEIWETVATAEGYSVIGGGDTVTAAEKYIDLENINYVCTAGGAMVRFLSGKKLALIAAMEKAYNKRKDFK